MGRAISFQNLFWLAPFSFLGLVALAPLRPPPVFPDPPENRIVTDAEGAKAVVPLPIRAVFTWGASDWLEMTHTPEALGKAGGPKERTKFSSGLMNRIYPGIVQFDGLWNVPADIESLLAHDAGGTYFGGPNLRRIGLASLQLTGHPGTHDELLATVVHVENAALGQEDQGEAFLKGFQQAYADLKQDLRPETLAEWPRMLEMGSSALDWNFLIVDGITDFRSQGRERSGVANATAGFEDTGRGQEAERVLAMNPDMILLRGESVLDFLHDPRWRGLKAVRDKRVYMRVVRSLRGSGEFVWGLDFDPLWARWLAEIAHPERLQPKLREVMRAHFIDTYGYRLSDDEIDNLLRVEENKWSLGYERFARQAARKKEAVN